MQKNIPDKWSALLVAMLLCMTVGLSVGCSKHAEQSEQSTPQTTEELPNVPLYPSGNVIERAYAPDGSFQIRMLTAAERDEVVRFYQSRLLRMGWRKIAEYKQQNYLIIFQRKTSTIHLSFFPTDDSSELLHVINYKE